MLIAWCLMAWLVGYVVYAYVLYFQLFPPIWETKMWCTLAATIFWPITLLAILLHLADIGMQKLIRDLLEWKDKNESKDP